MRLYILIYSISVKGVCSLSSGQKIVVYNVGFIQQKVPKMIFFKVRIVFWFFEFL